MATPFETLKTALGDRYRVDKEMDLTIRYFQFFDHYLNGAPEPKWMTDGVPYLVKDALREPKEPDRP